MGAAAFLNLACVLVPAAALLGFLASAPGGRVRAAVAAGLLRAPRGWFLAGALVLAAAVRVPLLLSFAPPDTVDMREYVEKAKAIADEGHPRSQERRPDGTRPRRTSAPAPTPRCSGRRTTRCTT